MRTALLLAGSALLAAPALSHTWDRTGRLLEVGVRVDGRDAPLFPARDGSGRLYVEARNGAAYDVVLRNRSSERLGVVLVVDGLNAVSGERADASSPRNRMYVLEPWGETSVSGWRTSLAEVRRFRFVDEQASYSARAGKANARMGWIEVGVFRERQPWTWRRPHPITPEHPEYEDGRDVAKSQGVPPATWPPGAPAPEARDQAADARERTDSLGYGSGRSYPGTGWGESRYDPAHVVAFDPLPSPAQVLTLRYEYASALRALGILPHSWWNRDRLRQRERAEDGFAQPPRW